MTETPEHELRRIRDYVDSQSPSEDKAGLVQKIGSRRVMGRVHDIYDVHCETSRWWVVTEPTNLYDQDAFPEYEQAFIFHLGLGVFLAERSRREMDPEHEEHVTGAWRRFRQALDAMDSASEAEDFQAVGIKCRDTLIALAKDHADEEWIGDLEDRPKAADFKGWGNIFAERLAEGRLRSYLKAMVDRTWDLTVWLQHYSDATPVDADIVLEATAQLLGVMSKLMRRREHGDPERCPTCSSYRLDEDLEMVEDPEPGFFESIVCGACGWRSEPEFTSWQARIEEVGVEKYAEYLDKPQEGPCQVMPSKKAIAKKKEGQQRGTVDPA